jgi:diacylglycerol kinase
MQSTSVWASFRHALRGIVYVTRTQRNMRFHIVAAVLVTLSALVFELDYRDCAILALAIGAVLAAEVGNTVVEAAVDLASTERSELAKIAKDAAAGAVLILALMSVVVGALILGPAVYQRLLS